MIRVGSALPKLIAAGTGTALVAALGTAAAAGPGGIALASAATVRPTSVRAGRAAPALATGTIRPGHWLQVTSPLKNLAIIPEIGLARGTDGVLHVVWLTGGSGRPDSIEDTPITARGRVGHPVTVARNWFLATDPDATATPGGLAVIWNGIKSNPSGPDGTFEATRPRSGGSWSVSPTVIPPLPAVPFTSSQDSAATGGGGKPWVAFSGTNSLVVDHFGHGEVQISPNSCCLEEAGLGTDGAAGKTSVAYASIITRHEGIFARPLSATGAPAGPGRLLPGSGASVLLQPPERVAITGRGHGRAGTYVAYGSGSPVFRALDLIRLGSRSPRKLAGFGSLGEQLAGTAIAADPAGRLWVSWFYGNGSSPGLFIRRSNPAAGTFGPAGRVALPPGTTTVFKVYISAQAGLLDVVALISRHNKDAQAAYWATEVLPPLALAAARSTAHGARVTLKVTDAGSPVRRATVRFCGHRAATPASGKVTFRVASVRHGRAIATAAKGGFAGARLAVKAAC